MTWKRFYHKNPEFLEKVFKLRRMFFLTAHGSCNDPKMRMHDNILSLINGYRGSRQEFRGPLTKDEKAFLIAALTVLKQEAL
jgi:hypothetical protein